MEKREYGTDEFYWIEFEIGKSYALNDLDNAGADYINSTHHAETSETNNIIVRNKEGIFKQTSMTFYIEGTKQPQYTVVNCGGWLNDGSSLNFESLVFPNGSGFVHLHHRHCIDRKEQYFKSFTNSEIIDMQKNAPDHPVLKMIDKVASMLESKGSAEKEGGTPEGAAPANQ